MVTEADNTPNHEDSLADIERPPGGDDGTTYDKSCVTRNRAGQFLTFKIPLVPAAELPNASATNNMATMTTHGISYLTGVGLPKSGPVGNRIYLTQLTQSMDCHSSLLSMTSRGWVL